MSDLNLQAAAASLYGGAPSPAAPAPAPSQPPAPNTSADAQPVKELGAALYGEKPISDQGADAMQTGELSVYAPVAREIESAATDRLGLTPEEAKASATEWGRVFQRYGVTGTDAEYLAEIGIAALANGVDDNKMNTWRTEARAVLTSEFGATADQALADAKRLVANDPTLAAWLDQTGLGNHPKVVATIAQRARHLRNSGRLK